ncbi:MAG TPA: 4Fe-4S dicluster domain-containing protein, partial [Burkholderiaceae bacterium]|nr:4Fe-4S dicluster domain-containing protein [Burkholderiaceae bacterium]
DWSAWNVQNDPLTEAVSAPGSGGDPTLGFAKAVEMCNNNGHCRKFDAGTMCPSYRITRDEQHLTRGRANTLRLALSGALGADALTGRAVHDALDLCVGCKGCKRDCPTGVDMARMKLEVQAQRRARFGTAWKDALVSRLPDVAPWASALPWLANLRNRSPALARWAERGFGLSARRRLPQWRRDTFTRRSRALHVASRDALFTAHADGANTVVLWCDTFNEYFEPGNAVAALKVLQAAGYTVHAPDVGGGRPPCCGRTHLAAGDTARARAKARALLDTLLPFAQRGIAIVGLEPSCLLTLRDEYLAMDLGDAARTVAAHALTFEEFIVREARVGRFAPAWSEPEQPILVHGHCHQKAFGLMGGVLEALRLLPGAQVSLIDSSCCGMAGSFGYEAAHLDASLRMAELSLLPAVRAAGDSIVVADGTSCRHQIADGAGRAALHVAEVLAQHLADDDPTVPH